ncbi:MAG: glycosyltransferase family 2 protein [Candidatus Omnitrophota bacterium]
MNKPLISIIMPALNEEANIVSAIDSVLSALDNLQINGEVIVINDGSSDNTPFLVKEAIQREISRVKMIEHDKPQGIGASFWDGVKAAQGEAVCLLPGDNENDPYEILRYVKLLDDVDIIVPFVYNKEVRTAARNLLSYIYIFIINSTFGTFLNYTNGTVVYRKALLDALDHHGKGFFFQTDILIRLIRQGYLFSEVPYALKKREKGTTKALSFSSLLNVSGDYFRLIIDVYFKRLYLKEKSLDGTLSEKRYRKSD